MATRCKIGVADMDGGIRSIYCHWDGYPEHVGKTLLKHYNTAQAREQLIALGHLSTLGSKIGEKHPFDTFNKDRMSAEDLALAERAQAEGWTLYYGRDRGETGVEAKVYKDLAEYEAKAQFEEFNYCYIFGEWYYVSYDGVVRSVKEGLAAIAAKEATEEEMV